MKKNFTILALLTFVLLFPLNGFDASGVGNVTRSGSTWTATVNGAVVYTGTRMFDAINAACNNMGAGVINIRNSGSSGPSGGSIYAIRPRAGQTLDFHNHTVHSDGGDLIVVIHADRRNDITIRNLRVTGNPRYGIWFRGSSRVTLHNIVMNLTHAGAVGLGIRVDNSTGTATNLTLSGTININGSLGHAIETFGVDGITMGDVTVTNTAQGCGVLLNNSRNVTIGTITGSFNNRGGGYATFRVANNNGPNVRVRRVVSRDSGRGFFSVSGSHGTTIESVDINNNTSHGIFLEDANNTHILSGVVTNCNPNVQLVRTTNSTVNVVTTRSLQVGGDDGGYGAGSDLFDLLIPEVSGLSIFPNPTQDIFNLVLPSGWVDYATTVTIFDSTGRTVYSNVVNVNSLLVDAGLKPGLYVVRVENNLGSGNLKLIVR